MAKLKATVDSTGATLSHNKMYTEHFESKVPANNLAHQSMTHKDLLVISDSSQRFMDPPCSSGDFTCLWRGTKQPDCRLAASPCPLTWSGIDAAMRTLIISQG